MIKFFTADWCTVCKAFKNSLKEGDLDDVEIIDIEYHPDQVEKYRLSSIPVFVKLDSDGEEEDRQVGNMSRSQFLSWKNE